jgi:hypothetical protein
MEGPKGEYIHRKYDTNLFGICVLICTGGPKARLAWAGARARRLWAHKAKYTSAGGEGTGEGARGTGTSACYLDFVSCPSLSNFLGPPLLICIRKW